MEEYIKDTILTSDFDDLVLIRLVDLTIYSIRTMRPLFASPLIEPAFFRKYFSVWVREAFEEKSMLEHAQVTDPFND